MKKKNNKTKPNQTNNNNKICLNNQEVSETGEYNIGNSQKTTACPGSD